tara:strand:- start:6776 stop:8188 length:1413 start_codon:yes stop_codon:yes gene_type:complete
MENSCSIVYPSLQKIADIVGGNLYAPHLESKNDTITGVSSDSRKIEAGNLFVAISGERYDGHDFVKEAENIGARVSLVTSEWHNQQPQGEIPYGARIIVPDVIKGLQAFSHWYRCQFQLPVVSVTGSNGKTTTKDIIANILGTTSNVFKTQGNLNSQLGVAESIFALTEEHDIAVFELGMNHAGQLDRLANMVQPEVGVITNVGPAHIEFFNTIEDIAHAKGEILDYLPQDGSAVLNADDPLVMGESHRCKGSVITFGRTKDADIRLLSVKVDPSGSWFTLSDGFEFHINLLGEHQVMNALAAVAVGRIFGLRDEEIAIGLEKVSSSPMRMDYHKTGGVFLIDDTYNANPSSMKAALRVLDITQGRKLVVLGDMLELGEMSLAAHMELGKDAARVADLIFTVGEYAEVTAEGAINHGGASLSVITCLSTGDAISKVLTRISENDVVLVKGSRGMKMEIIVESIEAHISKK